jgi:hypothetical protein
MTPNRDMAPSAAPTHATAPNDDRIRHNKRKCKSCACAPQQRKLTRRRRDSHGRLDSAAALGRRLACAARRRCDSGTLRQAATQRHVTEALTRCRRPGPDEPRQTTTPQVPCSVPSCQLAWKITPAAARLSHHSHPFYRARSSAPLTATTVAFHREKEYPEDVLSPRWSRPRTV